MECRRKGQLKHRRRLLLREELHGPGAQPPAGGETGSRPRSSVKTYTEEALITGQPRITDLVPGRRWTLLVLALAGAVSLAALELLHALQPRFRRWLDGSDLTSFDLAAPASLCGWFSSAVLLCAAAYALIIFSIRRHRLDDYRGSYGLWLWAAAGCLAASIDSTSGLGHVFASLLQCVIGTAPWGDVSIWWVLAVAALYVFAAARVARDMRYCWGGCIWLALATACYAGATAAALGWVRLVDDVVTAMFREGALLCGHLMILDSFLVYARHVYREAEGELAPARRSKTQSARRMRLLPFRSSGKPAVQKKTGGRGQRQSGIHSEERKPATSTEDPPKATIPIPISESPEEEADQTARQADHALSKAERRRLRKQMRRQNKAA